MPILLVSNNQRQINTYITDFVEKYAILPSFIFHYKKNPTVISIEQVREIQSHMVRVFSMKRLFVLRDFETARKETQNAFLKTLEEKGDGAYFILIVPSVSSVLPTIASRCAIRKSKVKYEKLKSTHQKSKGVCFENDIFFAQSLSQMFARYTVTDREKAVRLCDIFLTTIRDMMKKPQENSHLPLFVLPKILKEIMKTRNLILKNNINGQIAIDHILNEIKKMLIDKQKFY